MDNAARLRDEARSATIRASSKLSARSRQKTKAWRRRILAPAAYLTALCLRFAFVCLLTLGSLLSGFLSCRPKRRHLWLFDCL